MRTDDPDVLTTREHARERAGRPDVDASHRGLLAGGRRSWDDESAVDREHHTTVAHGPDHRSDRGEGPQRRIDAGLDLRPREPGEREDRPAVADRDCGLDVRPGNSAERDVDAGLHRPPTR